MPSAWLFTCTECRRSSMQQLRSACLVTAKQVATLHITHLALPYGMVLARREGQGHNIVSLALACGFPACVTWAHVMCKPPRISLPLFPSMILQGRTLKLAPQLMLAYPVGKPWQHAALHRALQDLWKGYSIGGTQGIHRPLPLHGVGVLRNVPATCPDPCL